MNPQQSPDNRSSSWRALPPSAIAFARGRLWLARDFEQPLAQVLHEGEFSAWTLASEAIPDARLEVYDSGGLADAEPRNVGADVAEQAVRVMQQAPEAAWVAPDSVARPGDQFLESVDVKHVGLGDAIYYVVERPEESEVRKSWDQAASAAGQLALVSSRSFPGDPTLESLQPIAEASQLVVITAYDGEGAIYLERRQS